MPEDARFERVTLRNGARAVREKHSGEVMHPSVGPWVEAQALYVGQGRLAERLRAKSEEPVRLWDVGLGGAANAAAALACAREARAHGPTRRLELVSFERDLQPLELSLEDPAGFPFLVAWAAAARALLRHGSWESADRRVTWTLHAGELPGSLERAGAPPELVFFDPFSPQTNTSLWTPAFFRTLDARLREDGPGTVLLTYSASTRTRVSMLLGGLFVGVGDPVGHKKQTTVAATRADLLARPLDARWLERFGRSSARAPWGSDVEALDAQVAAHPQFSRLA
jgi:tRNA U34 5-methylaminomethyl-2-thiouridine-forming methyltransferase MnmC